MDKAPNFYFRGPEFKSQSRDSIPIWVNIKFNINSPIYDRRLRESKLIFCLSFRLDSLVVIRVKTGASTASTTEGENVQVA